MLAGRADILPGALVVPDGIDLASPGRGRWFRDRDDAAGRWPERRRIFQEAFMAQAERIEVAEARRRVQAGQALLVCAYESEDTCSRMRLQGSLTLSQVNHSLGTIPRYSEIIFYCA
jgi:hypothetical protein